MSCYRIYKIDHFDPQIVGKNKRRLVIIMSITTFFLIIVFQIGIQILHIHFLIVLSALPLILAFLFYLNFKLKADIRKIRTIGELEFTRSCIKKRIGDIYVEYDFKLIKELELRKHLPGLSPKDSKSGYFSYILKIVFKNLQTESIIVSDRPIDKKQDLSIVETFRTLKKIIQPEITIIS
jgi:hypothetical protein